MGSALSSSDVPALWRYDYDTFTIECSRQDSLPLFTLWHSKDTGIGGVKEEFLPILLLFTSQ